MSIFDVLIILVILFGMYLGFQRGLIKEVTDFAILLVTMLIASPVSKLLCKLLYSVLPFFNFTGNIKGLKSLNLILWRMIFYFLIIIILLTIVRKVLIKLKLLDKISDSIVEAGLISKILGVVISFPLMILFLYNVLMIVNVPFTSLNITNKSKVAKTILEKTFIVSSQNKDIYFSENDVNDIINSKYNTDQNYKNTNSRIVKSLVSNNLISEKIVDKLTKKGKIVGKRKTMVDEIIDETELTSPTKTNNINKERREYND